MRSHLSPPLVLLAGLVLLLTPTALPAQPPAPPGLPAPRLLLVLPCGGQQGATQEVVVTGQELDEPQTLHFNFPGVRVEPLGAATGPMINPNPKKKKGGMQAPAANSFRFKVTLPAAAPPGIQDVRVVTKYGVSNPRAFVVGDGKEAVEKEPNNDVISAQRIELNSSVSGIIASPTDVDYFRFAGKRGQRVVVSCLTTSIDSRLPASVRVFHGDKELAANRNYFHNDALCDVLLPADGDYDVRVCSFGYTQSGPDHFYRLTVSTAPWIDAIHPCVVEPGKATDVTVYGRNLPGGQPDPKAVVDGRVLDRVTYRVTPPADPKQTSRLAFSGHLPPNASMLDGFEVRLRNASGSSNPFLLTYARAPVVLDNEANDTALTAQRLTLPCEVAGHIEKKGDRDWYAFSAKKGQVVMIELYGDRLGAPHDLSLAVRSASGGTVVDLDDTPEVMSNHFYSRTDDPPRYRFVAPADGDYRVLVTSRDAYLQAGPRYYYRLRLTPEQHGFHVVAVPPGGASPDAAIVRRSGQQAFTLYIWRLDGWDGDITVTGDNLPAGVTLPPQVLPAGSKLSVVVVSAADDAPLWTGAIRLLASAKVDGRQVTQEVRPATATWALPANVQNIPSLSRMDRELVLAVRERGPFNLQVAKSKFVARAGEQLKVSLKLQRFWPELTGAVQVNTGLTPQQQQQQPVTFTNVSIPAGKDTAVATLGVKNNTQPGVYTVVLRGQVQLTPTKSMPNVKKALTIVQPATPITIIVLPKQILKMGLSSQNVKVKAGQKAEVKIKLARTSDLGGEYKLELVLPKEAKGVRAEPVRVAAGQNEAVLVVTATPQASAGTINASVRATTMIGGMPVTQESKLTVNVTK